MRHRYLVAGIRATERAVGRLRLAKFARLVTNEVRLDTPNTISINGEHIIQAASMSGPAPGVLDVGGHFGEWSIDLLASGSARSILHVFEPSTITAAWARSNLDDRAVVHGVRHV